MTTKSPAHSQGKIITYSADAASGVILCESGQNYVFHSHDWSGDISELINDTRVTFNASSGRAVKVAKA